MQSNATLEDLTVPASATLREAVLKISSGECGICFVVESNIMVGLLTDGDLRRAILKGITLEAPVVNVMKTDFLHLAVGCSLQQIQRNLEIYKYIPILNSKRELVDFASARRYHQIPLVAPKLDGNELEYLTDCIQTGWISSRGDYISKFERSFADYVGAAHAVSVCNGTAALHLALLTLGIGVGDEVIVPDLTFMAPINAILYTGATPVLIDVCSNSMLIDLNKAEAAITKRTKAIVPVHLYGSPVEMDDVLELTRKYGIYVVEDCAEAIGTRYKGRHVGSFTDVGTFSFFGNKTITTGEGGMLTFRDPSRAERARILRDHGMRVDRRYWHDVIGYNYRLTNIQAAIGVAQMERVTSFVQRKAEIAKLYDKYLDGADWCLRPEMPSDEGSNHSYWLYTICLTRSDVSGRDATLRLLQEHGIEARPMFFPAHRMPPYKQYAGSNADYYWADFFADGGLCLPSCIDLTEADVARICSILKEFRPK